jgi:hypothetical protein
VEAYRQPQIASAAQKQAEQQSKADYREQSKFTFPGICGMSQTE